MADINAIAEQIQSLTLLLAHKADPSAADHSGHTVLWLAASALFSWYATNFGKFNETYGSLGAVIGFMTWLWISAIVISSASIRRMWSAIPCGAR